VADRRSPATSNGDCDVDVLSGAILSRNDGTGTFTATATAIPISSMENGAVAGDFDGDGDLDVLVSAIPTLPIGTISMLFVNDGSGGFSLQPDGVDDPFTRPTDVDTADLDGDGDLDAIVANYGTPRIWWNRRHHLSWRELPRAGWPLTLDLEGAAHDPFALAVAFASTQMPIPGLGVLRLDPSSLVVMATGALDAAGDAAFQAPVPALPALVGLTLHWQALTGTRLGNRETTTFFAP
jgi:hypothetical protein